MRWQKIAGALIAGALTTSAHASDRDLGLALCASMAKQMAPHHDEHGVFLPSYLASESGGELPRPMQDTAFVYDNALALMAFVACGQVDDARAIGDAFLAVGSNDRFYKDGRVRNAYHSGPVAKKIALPGWWDDAAGRWVEDEYQISTASGNVAWAALALLQLHEKTSDTKYKAGAERLARWLADLNREDGKLGIAGGYYGFEPEPVRIQWMSTEHNIDTFAAAHWLWSKTGETQWQQLAEKSQRFVTAMYREDRHFLIGTDNSGKPVDGIDAWLDVQVWPVLAGCSLGLVGSEAIMRLIDERFAVPAGYDFNSDRDGLWVEGTAQVALMLNLAGEHARASSLIDGLVQYADPGSGWLFATPVSELSTGLTIDAMGQGSAFTYHHWPHLGATAWTILAATQFNPFKPN